MIRIGQLLVLAIAGISVCGAAEPNNSTVVAPVIVSAAHTHELAGNYKFQTLFGNLAGFGSPTIQGSAPNGSLTFNPKTISTPGGYAQITFVDVKATFQVRCEVGASGQEFDIVFSEASTGGGSEKVSVTSGIVGTTAIFEAQAKPMYARGDFLIRISSDKTTQQWNLIRCDISANPQVTPNAPNLSLGK